MRWLLVHVVAFDSGAVFETTRRRQQDRDEKRVGSGRAPGLLAWIGDEPVGWCAIAPRGELVRLASARTFKPIDEQPVWSVTCFFVAKPYRRSGLTVQLLKAAVKFAARHGAKTVEGYPVDAKKKQPDVFMYTGLASAFRAAGFVEAARRAPTRPIMRWVIGEG